MLLLSLLVMRVNSGVNVVALFLIAVAIKCSDRRNLHNSASFVNALDPFSGSVFDIEYVR